jgi:hypothetical protein
MRVMGDRHSRLPEGSCGRSNRQAIAALTGMSRSTLYRRLARHAKAGRAIQVSCGRWRAVTTEEPPR